MKYRVIYRQIAHQDWQVREFIDRAAANAFKRQMRARLWAATVQMRHADGHWIDA